MVCWPVKYFKQETQFVFLSRILESLLFLLLLTTTPEAVPQLNPTEEPTITHSLFCCCSSLDHRMWLRHSWGDLIACPTRTTRTTDRVILTSDEGDQGLSFDSVSMGKRGREELFLCVYRILFHAFVSIKMLIKRYQRRNHNPPETILYRGSRYGWERQVSLQYISMHLPHSSYSTLYIEQGGCGQGGWMEESARVVQSSIGLLTYKTRALCLRKRQQRQWISQWMGLWNALVGVSVY